MASGDRFSMKTFFYRLAQWTWGFPQTLLGFLLYLWNIHNRHFDYHGSRATVWKSDNCVSLGMYIFVSEHAGKRITVHEYGHTIQSLALGPLYLLVIGIPSALWEHLYYWKRYRKRKRRSYYSFYTESWADLWGYRVTEDIFL